MFFVPWQRMGFFGFEEIVEYYYSLGICDSIWAFF